GESPVCDVRHGAPPARRQPRSAPPADRLVERHAGVTDAAVLAGRLPGSAVVSLEHGDPPPEEASLADIRQRRARYPRSARGAVHPSTLATGGRMTQRPDNEISRRTDNGGGTFRPRKTPYA